MSPFPKVVWLSTNRGSWNAISPMGKSESRVSAWFPQPGEMLPRANFCLAPARALKGLAHLNSLGAARIREKVHNFTAATPHGSQKQAPDPLNWCSDSTNRPTHRSLGTPHLYFPQMANAGLTLYVQAQDSALGPPQMMCICMWAWANTRESTHISAAGLTQQGLEEAHNLEHFSQAVPWGK